MERHKTALEETAAAGLLDIQRQREELDRKEAALIAGTLEEDRQHDVLMGKLLEETVAGTFRNGKLVWAPHGPEELGASHKAERERIGQSLRVDHAAAVNGANGTGRNFRKDGDYYYDSLESITSGTWLDALDGV